MRNQLHGHMTVVNHMIHTFHWPMTIEIHVNDFDSVININNELITFFFSIKHLMYWIDLLFGNLRFYDYPSLSLSKYFILYEWPAFELFLNWLISNNSFLISHASDSNATEVSLGPVYYKLIMSSIFYLWSDMLKYICLPILIKRLMTMTWREFACIH